MLYVVVRLQPQARLAGPLAGLSRLDASPSGHALLDVGRGRAKARDPSRLGAIHRHARSPADFSRGLPPRPPATRGCSASVCGGTGTGILVSPWRFPEPLPSPPFQSGTVPGNLPGDTKTRQRRQVRSRPALRRRRPGGRPSARFSERTWPRPIGVPVPGSATRRSTPSGATSPRVRARWSASSVMPQNGPSRLGPSLFAACRFRPPRMGWGKEFPHEAHHRGRDRALETLWRLAVGPDCLIPAIKIASDTVSPASACRRPIPMQHRDSATTSASRTWCAAFAVPLRSSTTTTATLYALRHVSTAAQGSTSWPGAVLVAPPQTVFVTVVLHGLLWALALQERRPRWPPRDPRPPCAPPSSAGCRVQIAPSRCQRKQPALWAASPRIARSTLDRASIPARLVFVPFAFYDFICLEHVGHLMG